VDSTFAADLVLEMLHRVGRVDVVVIDTGVLEALPQHRTGGTDERYAALVLDIARLLADEDQRSRQRTLAEHRLSGVAEQRATLTSECGFGERLDAPRVRHER
jgi:hypothetical protein